MNDNPPIFQPREYRVAIPESTPGGKHKCEKRPYLWIPQTGSETGQTAHPDLMNDTSCLVMLAFPCVSTGYPEQFVWKQRKSLKNTLLFCCCCCLFVFVFLGEHFFFATGILLKKTTTSLCLHGSPVIKNSLSVPSVFQTHRLSKCQ